LEQSLQKIKHESESISELNGGNDDGNPEKEHGHLKTLATISEICEKKDEVISAS
jgi:hypothetical protein